MKIYITFFITLGVGLLYESYAQMNFNEVRRFEKISPPNDYIESSKEVGSVIKFKKAITKDNPLLLDIEIKSLEDNHIKVYKTNLDMCKTDYNERTWDYFAVDLFTTTMIPGKKNKKCPVSSPQTFEPFFGIHFMQTELIFQDFEYGKYVITYEVKSSEGDVVFSSVKYSFEYKEQFQLKD